MTNLTVHEVFSDNMVLQRNTPVTVWGECAEGSRVEVSLCGQTAATQAEGGRWKVSLPPLVSGGPFTMTVRSDKEELVLRNILVGEVWLAGGQSNMEWPLNASYGFEKELAGCTNPDIRYYHTPRRTYEGHELPKNEWLPCTPATAGGFSAVGYYFAKQLQQRLGVPVGIIGCNWGGTSAMCWTSRETIGANPLFAPDLAAYEKELEGLTEGDHQERMKEYQLKVDEYVRAAEAMRQANPGKNVESEIVAKLGDFPWVPPKGKHDFLRPCGLYHSMLREVTPYTLAGAIWYQGESDTWRGAKYDNLIDDMLSDWRRDFVNPNLPFIMVQLPEFILGDNETNFDWAVFREVQADMARLRPNIGTVAALGYGEATDIHPRQKAPIGRAMAEYALKRWYGKSALVAGGPEYADTTVDGSTLTLRFTGVGSGLCAGNPSCRESGYPRYNDGELIGFEVCGEDGVYHPAKAVIAGDRVVLASEKVTAPTAARYGWRNYTEANLANLDGFPSGSFRTAR